MATQRSAAPNDLAEFVKLNVIGAAVLGFVERQASNQSGRFLTLSPAAYRASKDGPFVRFEEMALGLSTDLARKILPNETGHILLAVFVGTKPTAQSPMKLFNVFDITAEEAKALIEGADPEKLLPGYMKSEVGDTAQRPMF